MAKKQPAPSKTVSPRWYRGADIPMRVIRRFARQIAERFAPEKIILFGSYAYGTPHEESDVDLMVIMPARNAVDQALRIERAFERQFSRDLHVCTPTQLKRRLKEDDRDWFLYEVMTKGKVLYEAPPALAGAPEVITPRRSPSGSTPGCSRTRTRTPAPCSCRRRSSTRGQAC